MSRSSLFGLQSVPRSDARSDVASWYTPGWSDALGDRLLMFDNTTASGLELLRFKPEIGEAPGFEAALKARVADLRGLENAGLAVARSVRWLGDGEGLALVSTHVSGRRLSEMLGEARGAGYAAELLRQLAPVLATLHGWRPNLAHGTLTPGRIVVTAGGRLVIAETAVGGAFASLNLPAERLRAEFGLAIRTDDARLDQAQDLVQLGHVALSLLVGRAVAPETSAEKLATLLEYQAAMPWGPGFIHLRAWLERALGLSTPFDSAAEAAAIVESWPEGELPPIERRPRLVHPSAEARGPILVSPALSDASEAFPEERPTPRDPVRSFVPTPSASPEPSRADPVTEAAAGPPPARRRVIAALASLAAAEAVVIIVLSSLLWRGRPEVPAAVAPETPAAAPVSMDVARPAETAPAPTTTGRLEITSDPVGARVTVDGSARGVTPLTLALDAGEHTVVLASGQSTTRRAVKIAAGSTSTLMASLGAVGSAGGWITFETPLDLQVAENGSLLGTTRASRLMLPAGTHRLELTNAALGVRDTLTVDVQAGRTISARITVPNGSLSLNALPWANVWLDNQPLGTTPFANLAVPVGSHDVIWRHPQYGERRQTVVVTARTPVRIVTDLTK